MIWPGWRDYFNYFSRLSYRERWGKMSIPHYFAYTFFMVGIFVGSSLAVIGMIFDFPNLILHSAFYLSPLLMTATGYFYGVHVRDKTGRRLVRELAPHHRWDWTESPAIEWAAGIFLDLLSFLRLPF
jgi:hypothetical protein